MAVWIGGAITILVGWKVVSSTNAVYSLYYLVLTYCGAVGLMLAMGADYIGMIILVVYVGAIAVMFTFVVMMLGESGVGKDTWLARGGAYIIGLLGGWYTVSWEGGRGVVVSGEWAEVGDGMSSVEQIGQVLYGYNWPYVILGGLILLVAMIGAIMVTRKPAKVGEKDQLVHRQLGRSSRRSIVRLRECD